MNSRELADQFLALSPDEQKRKYKDLSVEVQREIKNIEDAIIFRPENSHVEQREIHLSPSNDYKLVVTPYSDPGGGSGRTQGLIYQNGSDIPIAEVRRNYGVFPHAWVEGHRNGNSYLICGEDYQGQTVVELNTTKRIDYVPDGARKGWGFCWGSIHPSPDGQMLAVEGCFWACPWEIRVYDFADPMNHPLAELGSGGELDTFIRWDGDNSLVMSGEENRHKTLSVSHRDLESQVRSGLINEDQYEALTSKDDDWETITVSERKWIRPSDREILESYIYENFRWRRKSNQSVSQDILLAGLQLLDRLPTKDKEEFRDSESGKILQWAIDKAYFTDPETSS